MLNNLRIHQPSLLRFEKPDGEAIEKIYFPDKS
jgi:hypothetical protein